MNQLSYYVTKRLIVGSKDSSGTIIHETKSWNELMNDLGEWRSKYNNEITSNWWIIKTRTLFHSKTIKNQNYSYYKTRSHTNNPTKLCNDSLSNITVS